MRLDHTRSSAHWGEKPGNWDKLNLVRIYESSNEYGIPDMSPCQDQPARLVAYNDRYKMMNPQKGDFVHFFLDDYRFETIWTLPHKSITKVARVGAALTPDFSLWTDMPRVMQIWQIYRSRWCGVWMQEHGLSVIPTVTWGDAASFAFCFAGIPSGTTVAVSTVGVHDQASWGAGINHLVDSVKPARILVYGSRPKSARLMEGIPVEVVYYDTRWAKE